MQNTLAAETPFLLEQWGRWARRRKGITLTHARMRTPSDLRSSGLADPLIADATAQWVDACVSQVEPRRARDCLVLHYVLGANYARITRELGIDYRTVKRALANGRQQVGELLGD